ncbi:MAG: glycine-rich domain-containing protein-like [Coxiellaceae bacterium]|nr:glycine-rich domain-containing protein-like [Coxiellaceae bacterium]
MEDAIEVIKNLDMSLIVKKLVLSGWKKSHAEEAVKQYKNLLILWKKHNSHTKLPPSEELDEVWHTHILDTQKYHQDCQAIFGRYLHHYPYFGIDEHSNQDDLNHAFENTQRCYYETFGEELVNVRLDFKNVMKHLWQRIF